MAAMRMKVQQIGEQLVVKIPKALARRNAIVQGSIVTLQPDASPKPRRRRSPYKLKDLLAKGKGPARGGEAPLGGPVGKEQF
jgi:antitoxin component of MazEF toxin-antitoxin module